MNLEQLVSGIVDLQGFTQSQAVKQVNQWLTLRNWMIGAFIAEYVKQGEDRTAYGAKVIDTIAIKLRSSGLKGMGRTNLHHFVSFYKTYPQIIQSVTGLSEQDTLPSSILQSVTGLFDNRDTSVISQAESLLSEDQILSNFSFTHIIEFVRISDPLKRRFYEVQVIKQAWSVRQLKRAMDSMLYERTGLSQDKEGVISSFEAGAQLTPEEIIRNPYVLEFLNLTEQPQYSESQLEQAIIDNLQQFLIEMGEGFCFETRQKRITFDNTHYHIDLVFYHRILKCHVIIDLKIGKFTHADSGQMNVYLNYFKDQMMAEGDNPPIGIILCADQNDALVKYATGGMDQKLFVSQYLVKLPTEEELKTLIQPQNNI